MARRTSFDFCFMLVNKRPLLLGVAFVANLAACRVRPELLGASGTVRTVTVIAFDQPFIYAVTEWTREFGAHVHVTRVTKIGRLSLHQGLALRGVMRRVAVSAANAVR